VQTPKSSVNSKELRCSANSKELRCSAMYSYKQLKNLPPQKSPKNRGVITKNNE